MRRLLCWLGWHDKRYGRCPHWASMEDKRGMLYDITHRHWYWPVIPVWRTTTFALIAFSLALALGWWLDHRALEHRAEANRKTVAKACADSQKWERQYQIQVKLNEGRMPGMAGVQTPWEAR